jgi:LysR family transcriptional regulator, glycine cleavage system transcriptional activator
MKLGRTSIPDIAVLQAFECAARHGNFTQAATELHLTQSAVSRQIRALELQLKVMLFERVRKRVVLSPAGKTLLPQVVSLLNQTEDMILRAMASSDGKDTLTVATLPTFGNRWLMRRLPSFLKANPGTVVNVASRSEPFDLGSEDFDVVIHYGQPVWAHATCTYLCGEVILPVGHPSLLATCPINEPSDLEAAPLLHLTTRPKLWSEWFHANGCADVAAYHGHRFDQFSMVIEAALQGLGFGLLPRYLIEDEIAAGKLQVALDSPMSTANGYYIVTPEGKPGTTAARTFQEWLLRQVTK